MERAEYFPFVLFWLENTVLGAFITDSVSVSAAMNCMGLAGGAEGVLAGIQLGLTHQAAVFFPEFIDMCSSIIYRIILAVLFNSLEHR